MATGIGAVKQAFVAALRTITDLTSAIGSGGIHEGVAIRNTNYPYVLYQVAFSVRSGDWSNQDLTRMAFDVSVVSDDQVEAHNLDRAILEGMHNKSLSVSGQTTLLCRRTADLSFAGLDDEGNKVYQVGGTYSVWTDQAM